MPLSFAGILCDDCHRAAGQSDHGGEDVSGGDVR
jgi:hypothetical protein